MRAPHPAMPPTSHDPPHGFKMRERGSLARRVQLDRKPGWVRSQNRVFPGLHFDKPDPLTYELLINGDSFSKRHAD